MAKKAWRLMNNPHSLAARIIKCKYFSRSSFLEAALGSNTSYVWQNVLGVKSLLKEGFAWQEEDGRDIKVWHDKWIKDGFP